MRGNVAHVLACGGDSAFDPHGSCVNACRVGYSAPMNPTILWIIAAILVIVGIVQLIQGQIIFGIVLIVIGCLVGPGGYSIFNRRSTR